MRLRKKNDIKAEIPTASMADIAFLLIVFFILTTKFQVDKQTVLLPGTVSRTEILAESSFISISHPATDTRPNLNGWHVRFSDGNEISAPILDVEDMQSKITTLLNDRGSDVFFVIKADLEVPYELFDIVREALKDSGARYVTFLSKQKLDPEAT